MLVQCEGGGYFGIFEMVIIHLRGPAFEDLSNNSTPTSISLYLDALGLL